MPTKEFSLSTEYTNNIPLWKKLRDNYAGEAQVKKYASTYVPQIADQTDAEYEAYINRAYLFNLLKKTVQALLGAVVRRPPSITPQFASETLQDEPLDGRGSTVMELTSKLLKEALLMGRVGMLVDYDQKAQIQTYYTEDLWLIERNYLGQVTKAWLHESVTKDNKTTNYVRELYINTRGEYAQDLYELDTVGYTGTYIKTVVPKKNSRPLKTIPLFEVNQSWDTLGDSLMQPLNDLNIAHFVQMCDYKHLLHYSSVPTLLLTGVPDNVDENGVTSPPEIRVGSENAMVLSNPDANGKWISADSSAASPIRNELRDIEERMGASAASLTTSAVSRETATSASQRSSSNTASVVTLLRVLNSQMTNALNLYLDWQYSYTDDAQFTAPLEFTTSSIDATMVLAMIAQYEKGLISIEQFLDNLERGELLGDSTPYEELQRLLNPTKLPESPEENKTDASDTSLDVDNNAI